MVLLHNVAFDAIIKMTLGLFFSQNASNGIINLFYFAQNENFKTLVPNIYEFNFFFVDVVVVSVTERLNVYYSTTQWLSFASLRALFRYFYYYKIEETCTECRLRNTNESKFKFIFSLHRRRR